MNNFEIFYELLSLNKASMFESILCQNDNLDFSPIKIKNSKQMFMYDIEKINKINSKTYELTIDYGKFIRDNQDKYNYKLEPYKIYYKYNDKRTIINLNDSKKTIVVLRINDDNIITNVSCSESTKEFISFTKDMSIGETSVLLTSNSETKQVIIPDDLNNYYRSFLPKSKIKKGILYGDYCLMRITLYKDKIRDLVIPNDDNDKDYYILNKDIVFHRLFSKIDENYRIEKSVIIKRIDKDLWDDYNNYIEYVILFDNNL